MSVDLDRTRDNLERLAGCGRLSPALVVLLRVRHTEATLDSDSDLLFSRLKVPNPNFLRREDALELQEPVLTERSSLSELEVDVDALLPSSGKAGVPVNHSAAASQFSGSTEIKYHRKDYRSHRLNGQGG
jgi:hypothetical protein